MHAIQKVASHEAVAAAAEHVQSGASGYDQTHAVAVGIEEALEQRFPFGVLMQLIEYRHGWVRPQALQMQGFSQRRRAAQQAPPVIGVVPVKIRVADRPASRSLSHLARPRNQGHLAMSLQMVGQDLGIEPSNFLHDDHYRTHRKIVQTILRVARKRSESAGSCGCVN